MFKYKLLRWRSWKCSDGREMEGSSIGGQTNSGWQKREAQRGKV